MPQEIVVIHRFEYPDLKEVLAKLDQAIGLMRNLQKSEIKMNDKLTAAITAAQAEVADTQGKDASIQAWIAGEPDRQAAALKAFADEHDVEESAAADTIATLTGQLKDATDGTFAAINSNPVPGDTPLAAPIPAGGDSGGGASTQDGGATNNSLTGGDGDDSINAGGGDAVAPAVAVVSSDPSVVGQTVDPGDTHTSVIVTDHPTDGTTLVTPVTSGSPSAGDIVVDPTTGVPTVDPSAGASVTLGDTTTANDDTPTAAALADANPSAIVTAPADPGT